MSKRRCSAPRASANSPATPRGHSATTACIRTVRPARRSHVETLLQGLDPIVAATDYVRSYPQLIAPYLEAPYVTLGTDGFGRSDTRAALRRFFEVDRHSIAIAALHALVKADALEREVLKEAIARYAVATDDAASWTK